MLKTRWSIFAILVLSAAGLTFARTSQEPQSPAPGKQAGMHRGMESVDQQLQSLSEKLTLTDDQKAKIKPILEDQMKQMKALHEDTSLSAEQKRDKMKSIHDTSHEQINAVLTPEQQTKFKEMQEHMGKHKE